MQNFFEKNKNKSTNPFAVNRTTQAQAAFVKNDKRLNIVDMEVLNNKSNSNIEYMEIRMNNLYNIIHNKSKNLDPITLENMKIEWETLRDRVYKEKQKSVLTKNINSENSNIIRVLAKYFNNFVTLFRFYNPKIKEIMTSFNEINLEVENLIKHSAPVGEEEKRYGMLVNKINQATKLNYKLSNEIK